MSGKTLKSVFWGLGIALVLAGSWAWIDRFANGDKNTNYGSLVPWGLWVAVYIYFIGLSAGAFLLSSLVYVFQSKRLESIGRLALFTALVTLLMALLSISADLGHTVRAWHVLAYPNFFSPMAWMIWLYTTYAILVVLEVWFVFRHDLVVGARAQGARATIYRVLAFGSKDESDATRASDRQIVRILAVIGLPLAVLFSGGVGSLFGVLSSRPAYEGGLFPIIFLVSSATSGGALLLLVSVVFQDGLHRHRETVVALGKLVLGLLVFDLLLLGAEALVGFYGNEPRKVETLKLIYTGSHWWVFWLWQIGVGTLIPLAIFALPSRRDPKWLAVAAALIVVGFLAFRLNIVIPGLALEEIVGLKEAIDSPRISTDYTPSAMEWLFSGGLVGIGLVLFGIGDWILPKNGESASEEVSHVTA